MPQPHLAGVEKSPQRPRRLELLDLPAPGNAPTLRLRRNRKRRTVGGHCLRGRQMPQPYSQAPSDELVGGPFSGAAAGVTRLGPADRIGGLSGAGHCVICRPVGSGLAQTRRLSLRACRQTLPPNRRACPPRARTAPSSFDRSVPRAEKDREAQLQTGLPPFVRGHSPTMEAMAASR